jgi:hypothetical protein
MKRLVTISSVCLLLGLALVMGGCGHQEYSIQKTDKSFIKFTGNPVGATAQLDGAISFALDADASGSTVYQIAPGKHAVVVWKGDVQVVNKLIYVGSQEITEVYVP